MKYLVLEKEKDFLINNATLSFSLRILFYGPISEPDLGINCYEICV